MPLDDIKVGDKHVIKEKRKIQDKPDVAQRGKQLVGVFGEYLDKNDAGDKGEHDARDEKLQSIDRT